MSANEFKLILVPCLLANNQQKLFMYFHSLEKNCYVWQVEKSARQQEIPILPKLIQISFSVIEIGQTE